MPAGAKTNLESEARELCEVVNFLGRKGWAPGTGGNFSVITSRKPLRLLMTPSGIEKDQVRPEQLVLVNSSGELIEGEGKPSAETLLHVAIAAKTEATCILHTHSVENTVLSMRETGDELRITGLEMLKGLVGVTTHEHEEVIPVFANSQDMAELSKAVKKRFKQHPEMHGFLLRGHGLYTWGRTMAEAKRHVEIFEFLFQVTAQLRP